MPAAQAAWTVLPPLRLQDSNTATTESLSSYARRLACLSGLPSRSLFAFIDTACGLTSSTSTDLRQLDGLGPVSLRRARSLEQLTGQPLLGASLYGFSGIVSARAGSLNRYAAWCPVCIRSQDDADYAIERLIWGFADYSHCSLHGTIVENTCWKCGNWRIRSLILRRCSGCGSRLDQKPQFDSPTRVQKWMNHCIEELVLWNSLHPDEQLQVSSLHEFMKVVHRSRREAITNYASPNRYATDEPHFRQWARKSISHCDLRYTASRVEIGDLLRFSAMQCISVLEVFLRPTESASELLPGLGYNLELPSGRGRVADERRAFARLLEVLLETEQCVLPSFQELTRLRRKVGSFKFGLPSHHARYVVQLRLQRAAMRAVPPNRINQAFRLGYQLQHSGVGAVTLSEHLVKRYHLSGDVALGIVRSAVIAYESTLGSKEDSAANP